MEEVLDQADIETPHGLRNRVMMEVLYSTGMRRKELIQLRLYDLFMEQGVILIREGKGKKDRMVPVGDRALRWTEKYLNEVRPVFVIEPDEGTLFLSRRGNPLGPDFVSKIIRDYIQAAGIITGGSCHLFPPYSGHIALRRRCRHPTHPKDTRPSKSENHTDLCRSIDQETQGRAYPLPSVQHRVTYTNNAYTHFY